MSDISQIKLPGDEAGKNIKALKLPYGECSTAAATAAKVVAIKTDNNSSNSSNMPFVLEKGVVVLVKFTITNTAAVANLTLSVNGTIAKGIKYRNANLFAADVLAANRTYIFTYDGTYWQITGDLDTNTNTWRSISVDGTQELGTGTDTGGVNFVGGDNITLAYASNNITVSATVPTPEVAGTILYLNSNDVPQ